MLTTAGHRLPGAPGRLVTETAAWGALIVLSGISYVVAGASGLGTTLTAGAFSQVSDVISSGDFDNRTGSVSLLVVLVLAAAGLFLPSTIVAGKGPAVRKIALGAGSIVLAALSIVLGFAPSAWLCWVASAVLGAVAGLLMSVSPFTNEKPWRRVGVPAALLVFISCGFQILGGAPAGTQALGWMSLLVGIALAAGAIIILLTPERALHAEANTTGAFPSVRSRISRPAETIANPWVCTALFAVLGTVFVLALPTSVENDFGQAGYALIVACALVGWAIGFEMGPTFAPGMSRPRVSAFALTVSGFLVIFAGVIDELSGKVVLSAVIAYLVGIGVRSQPYDFSRRVGAGIGGIVALGICILDLSAIVPLGVGDGWFLAPTEFAYGLVGIAALVGGIIGLFIFDPHGLQGLSVDIIHGFRPVSASETGSNGGVKVPTDRLGDGFFIALEGGDGSGKSTQIARVAAALADEGHTVESTREPGGTELGRKIRSVLFDSTEPPSPRTEALLFAADRAHHVASLVDPSLAAGTIVITDRYIDSTIAYQAAGREFDPETIGALSRWATSGLIPNLTVVLDIDPEVASERMHGRDESNYLDGESQLFHQRVRQTYLAQAAKEPDRYVVVDASVTPDELTDAILTAVRPRLPKPLAVGPSAEPGDEYPSAPGAQPAPEPQAGSDETDADVVAGASTDPNASCTEEAPTTVIGAGSASAPDAGPVEEATEDEGVPTERIDLGADLHHPHDDDVAAVEVRRAREAMSRAREEAATTAIPSDRGHEPTDDDPCDAAASGEPVDFPGAAGTSDESETTVLPVTTARQASRRKLLAQSEIERQARERLRQQRERNRNRFSGPGDQE